MNEKELMESLEIGDYLIDNSAHRYGKKVGYQWILKTSNGLKSGIEENKARAFARVEGRK